MHRFKHFCTKINLTFNLKAKRKRMHVGYVLGVEYNHVEEGLLEEVEVVSWALKNEEEFTRQIPKQGADIDFRYPSKVQTLMLF